MTSKRHLPRVKHLADRHAMQLFEVATAEVEAFGGRKTMVSDSMRPFRIALATDPTSKAMYSTAVIKWLLHGVMRFEDARIVRDTIERFHASKRRLPVDLRDIGRHETPGDLAKAIGMVEDASVADIPAEILDACPILAQGDGWSIFEVSDTRSASWWADSTSWCTRHPDTAIRYLKQGPLLVLNAPSGKYQAHAHVGQFMDRYDNRVRKDADIPNAALLALWNLLGKQTDLVRTETVLMLHGILKARGLLDWHKNSEHLLSVARMRQPSWMSLDGQAFLGTDDDPKDSMWTGLLGPDGHVRYDRTAPFLDEMEKPRSPLLGALRWSLRPVVKDMLRDGRRPGRRSVSIMDKGLHRTARPPTGATTCAVLVDDGDPILMWIETGRRQLDAVHVLDMDAVPGQRMHRLCTPDDFATAPPRIREAMLILAAERSSLLVHKAIGLDDLPNAARARWGTSAGKGAALRQLMLVDDADIRRKLLGMSLGQGRVEGTMRLLSGVVWPSSRHIVTNSSSTPPAIADLMDIASVPGAGILLAAFPDEQCTDDVVDSLIAAGRIEVLQVVPRGMLTAARIKATLAHDANESMLLPCHSRVLTVANLTLLHKLSHSNPIVRRMHQLVSQHVHDKSRKDVVHVAGVDHVDLDALCMTVLADFEKRRQLEARLAPVPPVGLPWPMAMRRLKRSLHGIEDVVASLLDNGGWLGEGRSFEERLDDLATLDGAMEVVAQHRLQRAVA